MLHRDWRAPLTAFEVSSLVDFAAADLGLVVSARSGRCSNSTPSSATRLPASPSRSWRLLDFPAIVHETLSFVLSLGETRRKEGDLLGVGSMQLTRQVLAGAE